MGWGSYRVPKLYYAFCHSNPGKNLALCTRPDLSYVEVTKRVRPEVLLLNKLKFQSYYPFLVLLFGISPLLVSPPTIYLLIINLLFGMLSFSASRTVDTGISICYCYVLPGLEISLIFSSTSPAEDVEHRFPPPPAAPLRPDEGRTGASGGQARRFKIAVNFNHYYFLK